MKITVSFRIEEDFEVIGTPSEKSISEGSYTMIKDEVITFDELIQTILYAFPRHSFPSFDVMGIYKDGKMVGHGEVV